MAATNKRQAWTLLTLLSLLITLSNIINSSHAAKGKIAIYWGQNGSNGEDDLATTCDSNNYDIVLLSSLNTFGCKLTPRWNFSTHCAGSSCSKLQTEIEHCQQNGVKVFLSIGGEPGSYSLCPPGEAGDAFRVADYLYTNFLDGRRGPLGSVTLDGIDFDIRGDSKLYWDNLAMELDVLRSDFEHFLLSASPRCAYPDQFLNKAIGTGLFDYIFVKHYDNPLCQYEDDDTYSLYSSWRAWTTLVQQNSLVFLGLPAGPDAAKSGYIPPDFMKTEILPEIKQVNPEKYGGVMLWNRYYDQVHDYSSKIKPATAAAATTTSVTGGRARPLLKQVVTE